MQTTLIAVMGLVSLFIGWILTLVMPEIRQFAWGVLGLGVILLASAIIIDFRRVGKALISRRGRFSAGTTIMISIFIGIILLANAISIGSFHRFDFTGLAQFTLTSQTKGVLQSLETPVKAISFFTPDNPVKEYTIALLDEYRNYTDQLSVKTVDPDLYPDQARQYGVAEYGAHYGTVVFTSQDKQRAVYGPEIQAGAEHAFTSAILEVTGTKQKKVYFLTGHGEGNIYQDYSDAREGLLDNLYQVYSLDLSKSPSIPDDCATLIIAGPQESLPPEEVEIIEQYLESDRQALILVNPNSPQGVKQLLSNWGVEIEEGIVIDPSSYVAPSIDSPSVPIDRNAFGLSAIYFPGAAALTPQAGYEPKFIKTKEGKAMPHAVWMSKDSLIQMYMLIWTSEDSWLETDFTPTHQPKFDEEAEEGGPLALSFLITIPPSGANGKEQGTALIVIGDSDFATNKHFYNGNNSDLFLTSVNWLAAGKEVISIDRKVLRTRRLILSPEEERFLNISSIGLLPLIVLVIGGIIWWRRR